jgi:hypothetical protein
MKMTTKLTDLVRNNEEITTIEELDKRGLITYRHSPVFGAKKTREAYFAEIGDTREGWEISKAIYMKKINARIGEEIQE